MRDKLKKLKNYTVTSGNLPLNWMRIAKEKNLRAKTMITSATMEHSVNKMKRPTTALKKGDDERHDRKDISHEDHIHSAPPSICMLLAGMTWQSISNKK